MMAGELGAVRVDWSGCASACVVLASMGYPGTYETGAAISGLERVALSNELQVFHAGTAKSRTGDYVTAGGRGLGVTAAAATLDQALARCYGAIQDVHWEGMQYRRDIGRFNER